MSLSKSTEGGMLAACVLALLGHQYFKRFERTDTKSLAVWLLCVPALPVFFMPVTPRTLPLAAIVAYLTYYAALLLSIAVYRLSPLHPLWKYPGPITCKLSKFWLVYISYKGHQHEYFRHLHDVYGPIVRVGPNELSILELDLIPSIMGANGMPKGPMWDGRRSTGKKGPASSTKGNLVGARDLQDHAEARRIWNRGFTMASVKRYEPLIIRRTSQLVDELKKQCTKDSTGKPSAVVDVAKWVSCFSFDFMGDLVFGGAFELLRDGDKNGLLRTIDAGLFLPGLTQHIPWCVDLLFALPWMGKSRANVLGEFTYKQVARRMKEGAVHDDLFYHISGESSTEKERPAFPTIIASAAVAIVAGSDTTATALSSAMFFLCLQPTCYERLRDEVDTAFPLGKAEPTDSVKLAQMDYLNAVINEALRLFPPAPTTLQRAPSRGSGGHLLGSSMFIPEGTAVYVPPYSMHHDPRFFYPEPDRFWPERWLAKDDTAFITNKDAFMPFSTGPANCVGKPLALIELRMVLAYMVQAFEMRLADGYDPARWSRDMRDLLVIQKGSLPLVLTPRVSC
ncbi:cytochrome P450 [Laetiporus sulphureus 93-53]|uniref:Cytochrome P450 n=1 Tax=Laetiporus sulphureus 93-53 TaxID=1314785 RepID=A0A165EZR2_9APHY|nr:cytochrome P450 [Laetiporus sulphureus 93-53]KZT08061.1 cytochrome P450 [Laetiporus sulphureus 93-53]